MIKCKEGTDETDASVLDSTSGFLFFGVPHQGMEIGSLVPLVQDNPNRSFLESLSRNSERLQRLEKVFSKAFGVRRPRIVSFYETERSPTAVEVSHWEFQSASLEYYLRLLQREDSTWALSGSLEVLVDIASATRDSKHQNPMNCSHFEMLKYSHEHDELYLRVRSALKPLVSKQSTSVLEIAEAGHGSA